MTSISETISSEEFDNTIIETRHYSLETPKGEVYCTNVGDIENENNFIEISILPDGVVLESIAEDGSPVQSIQVSKEAMKYFCEEIIKRL